jgi:hypothetical protein
MPVHYGGISCDMDVLLKLADERQIHVIEDAAHAIGARYKGRHLGTLGTFGCFSFHDTKNCVAGEGGALVINEPSLHEYAERIYHKGTDRAAFLRGQIDKYTWVSQGGSYSISAILGALLAVQLSRYEEILQGRQRIVRRYRDGLASLADEDHIRFTEKPSYATPNEHLSFFLVRDTGRRDALIAHLQAVGIQAYAHYVPLHLSPYAREHLGTRLGQFPVSERIAASIVRLPLFPQMSDDDCAFVIEQVRQFFHPQSSGAMLDTVDLSLVITCYREEGHLTESLDEIRRVLDTTSLRYEIILVDDASDDATPDLIRQYIDRHPDCILRAAFHTENQGRGAAVQDGFLMAQGCFVGFLDVDLEIAASYLPSALAPLIAGKADMVLADRQYAFQPRTIARFVATKGYRMLAHLLLRTPSLDTEAGFKFFRRDRIMPLLPQIRDRRWFWDTEVTVRSYDAGLRIHSVPVLFRRRPEKQSTVNLFRDSMRSFSALLRFSAERKQSAPSPSTSPSK